MEKLFQNKTVRQFVKFGIVGVGNTAVDWVIFFILTHTVMSQFETVAKAISFLVALVNSYIFNVAWTFKEEYKNQTGAKAMIFTKFVVVGLIGWGINTLSFDYARFTLSQSQIIALILASAAAILWNFFINKFWTFK